MGYLVFFLGLPGTVPLSWPSLTRMGSVAGEVPSLLPVAVGSQFSSNFVHMVVQHGIQSGSGCYKDFVMFKIQLWTQVAY